jgi:hypothetical protein
MADSDNKHEKDRSLLGEVVSKLLEVLAAFRLMIGEVQDHWDNQVERFLRRVEFLFILYLWISIGALFMVLGLFEMLTDLAKIPRPWVFSVGGLLIVLTAVIVLQSTRLKRSKKN